MSYNFEVYVGKISTELFQIHIQTTKLDLYIQAVYSRHP